MWAEELIVMALLENQNEFCQEEILLAIWDYAYTLEQTKSEELVEAIFKRFIDLGLSPETCNKLGVLIANGVSDLSYEDMLLVDLNYLMAFVC